MENKQTKKFNEPEHNWQVLLLVLLLLFHIEKNATNTLKKIAIRICIPVKCTKRKKFATFQCKGGHTHIHACFNNTLEICQRFKEVFVQYQHAATTTTTTAIRSSCAELRKSSFCQKKELYEQFCNTLLMFSKNFYLVFPLYCSQQQQKNQKTTTTSHPFCSTMKCQLKVFPFWNKLERKQLVFL